MSAPAKDNAGCQLCSRSAQQLAKLATSWWECSAVDCPQRKQLTAAPPPGDELASEGSGCWRVEPKFPEY